MNENIIFYTKNYTFYEFNKKTSVNNNNNNNLLFTYILYIKKLRNLENKLFFVSGNWK